MPLFCRRVGRVDELRMTRRRVARGPSVHLRPPALVKAPAVKVQPGLARADDEPHVARGTDGEARRVRVLRGPPPVLDVKVALRFDADAQSGERVFVECAKVPRGEVCVEARGAREEELVGVLRPAASAPARQLGRGPTSEPGHEGRLGAFEKRARRRGQPLNVNAREALVKGAPAVEAQPARRRVEFFEARGAQVVARAQGVEPAPRQFAPPRGLALGGDQLRHFVGADLRAAPVHARRLGAARQFLRHRARARLGVFNLRRAGERAQGRALRLGLRGRLIARAPQVFYRLARPEFRVTFLNRPQVWPRARPRVVLETLALGGGVVGGVVASVVARIHHPRGR